jgi:iron(III) transport system ATP-binding protein
VFDSSSRVKARVEHKLFAGTATHYQLVLESGAEVQAAFPSHQDFNIGDTVPFGIDTEHLITYLSEGVSD